jgi:hypothetical protein
MSATNQSMTIYAVIDDALSPDFPLGVELEMFIRREDAERFTGEVRGDDPELSSDLRIEERVPERGTRRAPVPTKTWVPDPPSSTP